MEKQCLYCGSSMEGKQHRAKYCSRTCKERAKEKRHRIDIPYNGRICLSCGNSLKGKRTNAKYCNEVCNGREYKRRRQIGKAYIGFQYAQTAKEQNNLCAICHHPETELRKNGTAIRQLAVDHNHKTGKVRKLLCSKCNRLIGILETAIAIDGPTYLDTVIQYLRDN